MVLMVRMVPISREGQIVRNNTIAASMLSPHTTAPVHRGATISSLRDRLHRGASMSDTAHPVSDLMHRIWISVVLFGVLAVILGVVMLMWPGPSIVVAAVLFGVYLVVSGIALVILAFSLPASGVSRFLNFISGVASVILGILAFRHFGQGYAVLLLAIWIGIGFIFRGVAAVGSAIGDPGLPGRGWSIFIGVISLLAGIVVLAWPFPSIVTLAIVVGAWFVVIGVFEIVSSFGIRKASKTPTG